MPRTINEQILYIIVISSSFLVNEGKRSNPIVIRLLSKLYQRHVHMYDAITGAG